MTLARRFLAVALIWSCSLLMTAGPVMAHYKTHNACKGQQERGDWLAFAFCMGNALGAPGGGAKTRSVVACESGGNRFATSASGTYKGLTQQHSGYYPGRVQTYAPLHQSQASWIYSGRWNLVVGIKMAKASGTWAGHWPYCGA